MRGPVAVQAQDCRGTVAQKPQCKLAKIANLCANRVFQPSIKPCVRIAPRICETAVRTSVSTVAPPESDTIAAARLPTLVSHHFAALSLAPLFAHHASSFSKVCGRAARGFRRRLCPGKSASVSASLAASRTWRKLQTKLVQIFHHPFFRGCRLLRRGLAREVADLAVPPDLSSPAASL